MSSSSSIRSGRIPGSQVNVGTGNRNGVGDSEANIRGPPPRSGSQVFLPRLIRRDLPFHQSKNRVQVRSKHTVWWLMWYDWFHILLRAPTHITISALLMLWTASIVLWALIYVFVDTNQFEKDCGLGEPGSPIGFGTGFAFSMITASTVGYGLPGSAGGFFSTKCGGLQAAIFFQMLWSMMFNAFLIAFFYSQLSKAENRSIQLVFADKLCINVKDGRVYANARCYDLDSAYPVVECHARMYLLDHKLKLRQLRLSNPNDDTAGMMYPSLPQIISHHIDHHSALGPRRRMPLVEDSCGLMLRSVDSVVGSRQEIVCPVCGENFGTYEQLLNHIRYNQTLEKLGGYPKENTHLGFEMPDVSPVSLEEVQSHIERTLSEIIVVVEGIDPQLSGTFQSVQSYRYDDIEFGADFASCLSVRENKVTVDMSLFHDVAFEYQDVDDSSSAIDQNLKDKPYEGAQGNPLLNDSELPPSHMPFTGSASHVGRLP